MPANACYLFRQIIEADFHIGRPIELGLGNWQGVGKTSNVDAARGIINEKGFI
jgi:hypothetical protein